MEQLIFGIDELPKFTKFLLYKIYLSRKFEKNYNGRLDIYILVIILFIKLVYCYNLYFPDFVFKNTYNEVELQ